MNCCICHKEIADCWPPLCESEDCEENFRLECVYNEWAKEQVKRDEMPKGGYANNQSAN